jgi:tripartite-type tricarboxylate transporter receptor subunit TctC
MTHEISISVLVVNPSVPAQTVPDFIAYARANPGRINMASAGNGTPSHLAGEVQSDDRDRHDTRALSRRGPAVTDLIGGQVQVYFSGAATSIEYIRAGKVRALGVTTTTRWEALPAVSPVSDFVPGYEVVQWYGLGAPKRTPAEIIERLNREVNTVIAEPGMKARLAEQGGTAFAGSPAEFGKLISDDTEKWGKVIRAAKIKADEPAGFLNACAIRAAARNAGLGLSTLMSPQARHPTGQLPSP